MERAEVTRGAMYFHFRSKEQLARGVLDEAVTMDGVRQEGLRLQQVVDGAMLLAHRLPSNPAAGLRLPVRGPRARALFGTRWPDWIELGTGLLEEAKERGELQRHVEPAEVARMVVSAWTGIQVVSTRLAGAPPLIEEISTMFALILPNVAVHEVFRQLDISPAGGPAGRGAVRTGE
ncbi:TetR family transcriptional regulator [Streptomyces sp. M19]